MEKANAVTVVSSASTGPTASTKTLMTRDGFRVGDLPEPRMIDMSAVFHWQNMPTIRGVKLFNADVAEKAAIKFRKGIQGGVEDGDALNDFIGVLGDHNNKQRREIDSFYKTMFGTSMEDQLSGELRYEAKDLALALIAKPGYYDAICIKHAVSGQFPIFSSAGTNEDTLIEILVTRTNTEIGEMKRAFKELYDKDVEQELKEDTSGEFLSFIVSLLNAKRHEMGGDEEPLTDVVNADVIDIAAARELGDTFSTFNRILCLRSFQHLRQIFEIYKMKYSVEFESALNIQRGEHLRDGYRAIVKYATSPHSYFEDILFKSIVNRDEKAFMRVLVSRNEKDLNLILREYQKDRSKRFTDIISGKRSSSYRQLLTALTANSIDIR